MYCVGRDFCSLDNFIASENDPQIETSSSQIANDNDFCKGQEDRIYSPAFTCMVIAKLFLFLY